MIDRYLQIVHGESGMHPMWLPQLPPVICFQKKVILVWGLQTLIYRLPPLPPTSPTLDDSMTRLPDSIRCWLAGLVWLLSSGWLLPSIHRFIDSSDLAAGLAGLGWAGLAGWLATSSIFMDFRRCRKFHGFQRSEVRGLCRPFRTRYCP